MSTSHPSQGALYYLDPLQTITTCTGPATTCSEGVLDKLFQYFFFFHLVQMQIYKQ